MTFQPVAFLIYCYRAKAVFHNLCIVLNWRLCGLTNSPIVIYNNGAIQSLISVCWEGIYTLSTDAYEILPKDFRMANCFVVSHKTPRCALSLPSRITNKSLEKLQDFFFKTETKTTTKCSRPRLHDPRTRLSFLSSRCLTDKMHEIWSVDSQENY